jgi:hypothetical protein
MDVLKFPKSQPLDAGFNDSEFEAVFLHNGIPGVKAAKGKPATKKPASPDDRAEIWALFDKPVKYNGLNILRQMRNLWGIHTTLSIGARSTANPAVRGICRLAPKRSLYFEGYAGNISDATRHIITISPYSHAEKSRALSQKMFVRIVVPIKNLPPLEKVDTLLFAYAIAVFLDPDNFAGIVDPDMFLFVPPEAVRAGLAHYHRSDRLLNTHLLTGFNFYEHEGEARFFTHGQSRFGVPEFLTTRYAGGPGLTTADYAVALRQTHATFLRSLVSGRSATKGMKRVNVRKLPEQVAAMVGPNIVETKIALAEDSGRT